VKVELISQREEKQEERKLSFLSCWGRGSASVYWDRWKSQGHLKPAVWLAAGLSFPSAVHGGTDVERMLATIK
jgi:hypothetical protein